MLPLLFLATLCQSSLHHNRQVHGIDPTVPLVEKESNDFSHSPRTRSRQDRVSQSMGLLPLKLPDDLKNFSRLSL